MNEFKKTTVRLTVIYSIVFFGFIWLFSSGIYLWTNNALGKGYVNHINELVEQSSAKNTRELSDDTATIAADVALDRMRNIILIVNGVALILIPTVAYQLSKRSLRPLVKSQEQQQQFISSASHELRTPLAVMAGELELAAKKQRTVSEYKDTIINTRLEVERMTALVRELLLLTRIRNDEKLQNIMIIESKDLMHEVTNLYERAALKKQVTFKNDFADFQFKGNRELLVVALGNLLDNAVKFSLDKSTVKIAVSKIGNIIEFRFTNKAESIPPEKLARLFERFYQTDVNHLTQGYGLGLAITKQIIELHHGSIAALSEHNEIVIKVNLPLA